MSAVSGIPLLSAATAGMTGTWVGRLSENALWSPLTSMWPVTTVSAIFFQVDIVQGEGVYPGGAGAVDFIR